VLRTKTRHGCDGSALPSKEKTATAAPSNTGTAKRFLINDLTIAFGLIFSYWCSIDGVGVTHFLPRFIKSVNFHNNYAGVGSKLGDLHAPILPMYSHENLTHSMQVERICI